jgi:DNA-binding MarR family transcriptional regulator
MNDVIQQIFRLNPAIRRKMLAEIRQSGYDTTFEQFSVMNFLYNSEGVIQSDLAAGTLKDKTNITRILDILQRDGYIERRSHRTDRRSTMIFLTDSGKELTENLLQIVEKVYRHIKRGISEDDLIFVGEIVAKMNDNLADDVIENGNFPS